MAGGIDWYRAHHGTVEDPKLGLIARCAGQRRGDVIAMWHYLMEKASGAEERGNPGSPHFRSLDYLLELEAGGAERIYTEFVAEGLVDGATGRLCAWDRRQPKREREDNTATERQRAKRERDAVQVTGQVSVTPCHATSRQKEDDGDTSRQKTPRGEESREEENSSLRSEKAPRKRAAASPSGPDDVDPQVWADWQTLRAKKRAPVTDTVVKSARDEAAAAGLSFEAFLRVWCARGSQGLQADWLKPHELRAAVRAPPLSKQTELESRNAATAARLSERFSATT